MKMPIAWVLLLALVPCVAPAQEPAQPDAEGCKDSPVLTRIKGCNIYNCEVKDFDAVEVQVGAYNVETGEYAKKALEGRIESLGFECPQNVSHLQIARNAGAALRAGGFSIALDGRRGNEYAVTAQKGPQWVEVVTDEVNGQPAYNLTTALVKGMAQEMSASAQSMAEEIEKSGHVAVYGINFDTGKATLRPDSDAVLGEIAKLLSANPALKVRVEGHTDNVGAKVANQALAEQRASAVVAWLAAHGVARARLGSQGFGDTRPVADNGTEDGRAKNRRVELVKQ